MLNMYYGTILFQYLSNYNYLGSQSFFFFLKIKKRQNGSCYYFKMNCWINFYNIFHFSKRPNIIIVLNTFFQINNNLALKIN